MYNQPKKRERGGPPQCLFWKIIGNNSKKKKPEVRELLSWEEVTGMWNEGKTYKQIKLGRSEWGIRNSQANCLWLFDS